MLPVHLENNWYLFLVMSLFGVGVFLLMRSIEGMRTSYGRNHPDTTLHRPSPRFVLVCYALAFICAVSAVVCGVKYFNADARLASGIQFSTQVPSVSKVELSQWTQENYSGNLRANDVTGSMDLVKNDGTVLHDCEIEYTSDIVLNDNTGLAVESLLVCGGKDVELDKNH